MRESYFVGQSAAVVFQMMLIALVAWLLMIIGAIALVIWALYLLISAHAARRSRGDNSPTYDWWAIAAGFSSGAAVTGAHFSGLTGGWSLALLLAATVVGVVAATRTGSRPVWTRRGVTTSWALPGIVAVIVGFGMVATPPMPFAVPDARIHGDLATAVQAHAVIGCAPGTIKPDQSIPGLSIDPDALAAVSSCMIATGKRDEPTYIVQTESPDALVEILQEGAIVARTALTVRGYSAWQNGAILVLTSESNSGDAMRVLRFGTDVEGVGQSAFEWISTDLE